MLHVASSPYFNGCLSLVGKDMKVGAVGRQFEPYLTAGSVCMLVALLWCDLGYSKSRKLLRAPAF